jgi:hypothetical protein
LSKLLEYERVAYFDVDETIVLWKPREEALSPDYVELERNGVTAYGKLNVKIAHKMLMHKFWGDGVVVWSNSGGKFAQYICKQFNLDKFVDQYLSKPFCYYDDLKCEQFMDKHRYEK